MNQPKLIITLAGCLLLISCISKNEFDKKYFEKITQTQLPEQSKVLQSYDNGEYLTEVLLNVDSNTIKNFIVKNDFKKVSDTNNIHVIGIYYLDKNYQKVFSNSNQLFFKEGYSQKNNWLFLANLPAGKLYVEISYPDWGGN